jgi:hypothetical protein
MALKQGPHGKYETNIDKLHQDKRYDHSNDKYPALWGQYKGYSDDDDDKKKKGQS